jgi:hypothetical protein
MVKLDVGNVLIKPSIRRQMGAWLRRSVRLGERMGNFDLAISLEKAGNAFEARAVVRDSAGDFAVRTRARDCRDAMRALAGLIAMRVHEQRVRGLCG